MQVSLFLRTTPLYGMDDQLDKAHAIHRRDRTSRLICAVPMISRKVKYTLLSFSEELTAYMYAVIADTDERSQGVVSGQENLILKSETLLHTSERRNKELEWFQSTLDRPMDAWSLLVNATHAIIY